MLVVEDYNEKRQLQREDAVTQAYYTAAFQRMGKVPKLERVLEGMRPKKKARQQTPEEMLAMAKRFNSANGGVIRGEG